jgi:glycosyltransferase involved in cell wall biosynthesis
MNIGVDARMLTNPVTGIGRYSLELSKQFMQFPNLNFYFYSPTPIPFDLEKTLGDSFFRSASSHNRISKMAWAQTKLPYWAKKDRVDLFWGPTHRIPRLLPISIARVVTIHDLVWNYVPHTMRPLSLFVEKRLMPEAIALADLVIADSQSTEKGIAEVFPQFADKVRVIHLGVSALPSHSNSEALLRLNISRPYFLFVGTIEPRKNLDQLLKAFALIPETYRNQYSLVIAGGKGWGGVNLERLIGEYGLNESVKVLGYVTDHELATLYSNARFLIMPSIYEGFGLPLLEAMQCGTPVLTSQAGSMAEVAGDGGIFIDPYSIESISFGIQRMLADDDLIKNLGRNALRRSQDFSWEKCAAETMAVFQEAMTLRDIRMSHS